MGIGCLIVSQIECNYFGYTDCYDPPAPSNGTVNLTVTGVTTYKATAKLYCNKGYSLNGNNTLVCNADGTWIQNAECIINGVSIILHFSILLHYMLYGESIARGYIAVDNMD